MCNSYCVITHVKCIHNTLKNNTYTVRQILGGVQTNCINLYSHGQYKMANARVRHLAEGERESLWKGGGWVLYPSGDSHMKQAGMLVGNFGFNP